MDWFIQLFTGHSTAHTVIILSLVIAAGVSLGHIKVFGISLGIAGVLFSGLAFGHFHLTVNEEIIEFAREFGLILFVYTIGMQVGPGFFASFRRQGLKLNLLAISVVLLGVATAIGIHYFGGVDIPVVVGLLSGAVTNTPGLGAAQQALRERLTDSDILALPGMAYAVAYPFGILGIIFTMIAVRFVFRINPEKEAIAFDESLGHKGAQPANYNISVSNSRLVGQQVRALASLVQAEFVISRLLRQDKVEVPNADTVLQLGDILHVVCTPQNAEKLAMVVGDVTKDVDVRKVESPAHQPQHPGHPERSGGQVHPRIGPDDPLRGGHHPHQSRRPRAGGAGGQRPDDRRPHHRGGRVVAVEESGGGIGRLPEGAESPQYPARLHRHRAGRDCGQHSLPDSRRARAGQAGPGRRPVAGVHPAQPLGPGGSGGVVSAVERQPGVARSGHHVVPGLRGPEVGRQVRGEPWWRGTGSTGWAWAR
jgi:AspT/YidE/YbjL antiporter-like protein